MQRRSPGRPRHVACADAGPGVAIQRAHGIEALLREHCATVESAPVRSRWDRAGRAGKWILAGLERRLRSYRAEVTEWHVDSERHSARRRTKRWAEGAAAAAAGRAAPRPAAGGGPRLRAAARWRGRRAPRAGRTRRLAAGVRDPTRRAGVKGRRPDADPRVRRRARTDPGRRAPDRRKGSAAAQGGGVPDPAPAPGGDRARSAEVLGRQSPRMVASVLLPSICTPNGRPEIDMRFRGGIRERCGYAIAGARAEDAGGCENRGQSATLCPRDRTTVRIPDGFRRGTGARSCCRSCG